MADIDLTTYEQDLVTVYTRGEVIEPYEREQVPFLNGMKEASVGTKLRGSSLKFRIRLSSAYSNGLPGDAGDWPRPRAHQSVQAEVTRAMIQTALRISLESQAAAEGEGSFNGDALADAVRQCLQTHYWFKDCLILGHGTARLAVVAADVVASDTVVLDGPWFGFKLRENLFIEFADLDTGGTVQNLGGGSGVEAKIVSIDLLTHTIVLDRNVTVSAGWSIYKDGTYGHRAPNGQDNIIDDGSLTTSIFGKLRATYPKLNATVLDNGGVLQNYSENLVRDGLVQITQRTDVCPTDIWSNEGIRSEHYLTTIVDRQFTIITPSDQVPKYNIGGNGDEVAMHFNGKRIPFRCDRNLPARTLFFSYGPGYRKHTLLEDDWIKEGGGMLHLGVAEGGETYKNELQGSFAGNMNISHRLLIAQGKIENIRDRHSARD